MICPKCNFVNPEGTEFCGKCGQPLTRMVAQPMLTPPIPLPTIFASGRYQIKEFLGEGGKKKDEGTLSNIKSAICFHIGTFGDEEFNIDPPILEAFVAETGI
jgi:zinc-ribbon domain